MATAKRIVRQFTIPTTQGAAALLVGSVAEGLPLVSMKRRGEKVTAVYRKISGRGNSHDR